MEAASHCDEVSFKISQYEGRIGSSKKASSVAIKMKKYVLRFALRSASPENFREPKPGKLKHKDVKTNLHPGT